MGRASQAAQRAKRDADLPERIRELAEIDAQNLPRREGDALGCFQWTDFRSGKVRRWVVRIGARCDQITVEAPGGPVSGSHGWSWFMTKLRKAIFAHSLS